MRRRIFLALACTTLLAAPAHAAGIYTGALEGVALSGFDAVSYFGAMPLRGTSNHMTKWQGADWYFSSAENLAAFMAAPEKFAPQYGGYCAYAVAKGSLAPGDPEAWTVHDGKLYVNLSPSIKLTWEKDIPGYVGKADANWPGL